MRTELIEKLRLAANQFYLNKYMDQPKLADSDYDKLVEEYEAEGGSVKDLVEWEDIRRTNVPLPKVEKTVVGNNDLEAGANEYLSKLLLSIKNDMPFKHYLNYKYDGSSIIAYYTPEGKLHHILGTPDQELCMDRTKNCWNIFPHNVTPGIECIQGEFLVDADQYGELARNKANGLLNSKDMITELENEGFVRAYQMRFYDGNWTIERLMSELTNLETISYYRDRGKGMQLDLVFGPAEQLKIIPTSSVITENQPYASITHPRFQVDGIVVYSTMGYHALKFYYTDSAVTTIDHIEWNQQYNGSLIPKLIINPVVINGKNIGQVASGGVSNMMASKMGKDAKVRVILSGMTIPKIVDVIEPSEDYQFPTCECGHQFSEKDIIGGGVKCQGDYVCSMRYKMWSNHLVQEFNKSGQDFRRDWLAANMLDCLRSTLNIDRVDLGSFHPSKEWYDEVLKCCVSGSADNLLELVSQFIKGGTAYDILKRNYVTAFNVLHDFLNYSL